MAKLEPDRRLEILGLWYAQRREEAGAARKVQELLDLPIEGAGNTGAGPRPGAGPRVVVPRPQVRVVANGRAVPPTPADLAAAEAYQAGAYARDWARTTGSSPEAIAWAMRSDT